MGIRTYDSYPRPRNERVSADESVVPYVKICISNDPILSNDKFALLLFIV